MFIYTVKEFTAEVDNQRVEGVVHRSDTDNWIFFCHGFGSNKEGSYKKRCEFLKKEKDYNCVRFDFRGNGESEGDFIDSNLSSRIKDLRAVIDHFDPEKCIVFGSSFGGKVAFHAALEDERIRKVIGKAPVTYNSIMDKFRAAVENKGRFEYIEGKPIDSGFFDDFDEFSFKDVEENLEKPVLIVHGGADTTVKLENSLRAVENVDFDMTLLKLKGEKHKFSDEGEMKMLEEIKSFV